MYTTGVAIVTSRLYYTTFILIKRLRRRLFNRSSGFNAFGDHFKFFIKTPKHLLLKMRKKKKNRWNLNYEEFQF